MLGSLLTFGLEAVQHRIRGRRQSEDSRRLERSQSYVDYLNSAHEAAHLLGRATPGCRNPLGEVADTYWKLDSDVARRLRAIELLGSDVVVERAQELRQALMEFRERVTGKGMVYASSDYWIAYDLVAKSRDALIKAARG